MKEKTLNSLIKLILFVAVLFGGYTVYNDYYNSDTVKIANWNLQIFGQSKLNNMKLMQTYSEVVQDYDIIFVQEIRDASQTAFPRLCSMLVNYSCMQSSRAGRTSSQEQYGIIYKKGINITSFRDYNPDAQDRWERPPIRTVFDINDYQLIVYNIHIKPEDAQQELNYLENLIVDSGNVLVLGDLNADCSYYNNEKQTEFDNWNWIIKDDEDTTSSNSNCAYDRIILNDGSYKEYVSDGIYTKEITPEISDHYLVWVEMNIN